MGLVDLTGLALLALVTVIYLADRGTSGWDSARDVAKSAGIVMGLGASALMCLVVLLASRIPLLDRLVGHDRAIGRHSSLGSWVVGLVAAHGVLLTWSYAQSSRVGLVSEFVQLWGFRDYALAVVAGGLLVAVGVTSGLMAVRKHLPHQLWFGIHLTTYAAIALSIPHQFSMDSMFDTGWAKNSWLAMYGLTAAALLSFRVLLPLFNSRSAGLRVTAVTQVAPGTVAITMTGDVASLDVKAGQFLNWRFWTPSLAWESHPFSISAAPTDTTLRITVAAVGNGTRRLLSLKPGTRVGIEGPYGVFTSASRTRQAVVLMGSGTGIAPHPLAAGGDARGAGPSAGGAARLAP